MLLGRLAAGFAKAYPEVRLNVTMEDRAVDLVAEGYDVVIRLNPKPDSTLVGRCFVRNQLVIVASPSLPIPSGAEGETLPVVVRTAMPNDPIWHVPGPDGLPLLTRTVLELPTLPTVRDAVLTGIGAARLSRVLVAEDLAAGRLVHGAMHRHERWSCGCSMRRAACPAPRSKPSSAIFRAPFRKNGSEARYLLESGTGMFYRATHHESADRWQRGVMTEAGRFC